MRMLPAGRVTGPALRGLSRFADTRGLPAGRESWLDYDVIEAFCVAGLAGRAPGTRGTYRSALYRLAEAAHGPAGQRATPFPGARAPAPYSPAERAELAALAAAQRDPAKRSSALAMIVFGIGAGLRPGELVALRGDDVARHGSLSNFLCKPGQSLSFCYITVDSFRCPGQTGTRSGNVTANAFMAAFQPRVPVPRCPLSRTSPSPSMWRPVTFLIPR